MSVDADREPTRRPVRLVVRDDLRRRRLTVFFRVILAIPLLIVYVIWTIGVFFTAIAAWFVVLARGQLSDGLHGFMTAYVRFGTRLNAYLRLVANPFPGLDTDVPYPVDVEIDGPAPQRRWTVAFRLFLAIPALAFTSASGGGQIGWRSAGWANGVGAGGTGATVAVLGWFASLARGRMPQGLRDLGAYGLGYSAQTGAYLLLLTDRYPSADPRFAGPMELPDHPVDLELRDDLARPRLLVFFRILLALPHLIWITLWSVAVLVAALVAWVITAFAGRLPSGLHRFFAAYVRYASHLTAFLYMVGGPFPGFVGAQGSYPVDIRIAPPERQARWGVVFRGVLLVPALLVAGAYSGVLSVAAVLGWFASLVRGRMPEGLRNIGAAAVRYQAQTWGYALLLTSRYPYACPALEDGSGAESAVPALPPEAAESV